MNPQEQVALTPTNGGGVCISYQALRPADIVISTTTALTSAGIRIVTLSDVSHVGLYLGDLAIVEAIGTGVIIRSLDLALADDALAVVYRHTK